MLEMEHAHDAQEGKFGAQGKMFVCHARQEQEECIARHAHQQMGSAQNVKQGMD